jgi:hypothetical protein
MSRLLFIVLAGSCSLAYNVATAQTPAGGPISSADVYIDSVTGSITPNSFTCAVKVNNQNDDDSQGTMVVVLLPLQVEKILNIKKNFQRKCTPTRNGPYVGYITCELGSLPVNSPAHPQPPKIIDVTTSPSTALPGYPETCSAFIYSAVGDIDKKNNYCYWPPDPDQPSCPFQRGK